MDLAIRHDELLADNKRLREENVQLKHELESVKQRHKDYVDKMDGKYNFVLRPRFLVKYIRSLHTKNRELEKQLNGHGEPLT